MDEAGTTRPDARPDRRRATLALIAALLATVLLTLFARNRYTMNDAAGNLLLSESIVADGSIRLDNHGERLMLRHERLVRVTNGHTYYRFPIGTALASTPVVAAARLLGYDIYEHEAALQILIAALTSAATLLLLVRVARRFVTPTAAVVVASTFWFGSSLTSTLGTALWSHNFAVLFATLAIQVALGVVLDGRNRTWPLLGLLLFAAYLCRPTMALLVAMLLLFVLLSRPAVALKAGLVVAALLLVFAAYSRHELGQWLPDYYLPSRLHGESTFLEAVYGNLLSPSRGLLVFSPFVLTVWACWPAASRSWPLPRSWLLLGVGWPFAHLAMISTFPHWWGGHSYGSRLTLDVMPGLMLLTLRAWPMRWRSARGGVVLLAASAVFAIGVHSGQGLFNPYTRSWNIAPHIDRNPQYLFDWHYPQFLANEAGHRARKLAHELGELEPLAPQEALQRGSAKLLLQGWATAPGSDCWSFGPSPTITFKAMDPAAFRGEVTLELRSVGSQRVGLALNGTRIHDGSIAATGSPQTLTVGFDRGLLQPGANELRFDLPDAQPTPGRDGRLLAIALDSIAIR